jgi:hypothetical protein
MTPELVKSSVAGLRARYDYAADGALQSWRFMRPDANGQYSGDCEDFVLTALEMICGGKWAALRAIATGAARIVRVTHTNPGETPAKHVVGDCAGLRFDNSGRAMPPERFARADYGDDWTPIPRAVVLFQIFRLRIAWALFAGTALGLLAWAW